MRSTSLLLFLVLLLLAPTGAHAATCPTGTTPVGAKKSPNACLAKTAPTPMVALQRVLAANGKAHKKGARRSKRAERLLQTAYAWAAGRMDAGEPVFVTGPGATPRGLRGGDGPPVRITNAPASLGNQVQTTVGPDASISSTFETGGVKLQMTGSQDHMEFSARDRTGAGGFVRFGKDAANVPRCPTAAGDVPVDLGMKMTIGQSTTEHGKRTTISVTLDLDGSWHGYVGVGGKAERFDVSLRTAMEFRLWIDIAATGKVLEREPTRTFRAALDRKGLPIGTSGKSVVGDMRLRGPKGKSLSGADLVLSSQLVTMTAQQVDLITGDLKFGDERWYDRRMCATTVVDDYTPGEVTKGGTVQWSVRAITERGEQVADARWTPSSSCGQITESVTQGPVLKLTVADSAGAWGWDPYKEACATSEMTSTAGRASAWSHAIPPKQPGDLRISVSVTYNENMGSGITETNMTGSGSVVLPWNADEAESTGTYTGTEWDGTIGNPCGNNMTAVRGFSGTAIVGADRNDDGTLTVAFVTKERPLRMSWLLVVPMTGEKRQIKHAQPFCGTAGLAKTTADVTVTVSPM
ncbi:MAG: hypothetical protein JHC95_00260 [Solirubrobacteraceae bacterium]|nr:hypothetical protein [Solirubrobacteraceae bacterium]